jgi:hypothetical protein
MMDTLKIFVRSLNSTTRYTSISDAFPTRNDFAGNQPVARSVVHADQALQTDIAEY